MGQCKAAYKAKDPSPRYGTRLETFYCLREAGHKGDHEDHWGRPFTEAQNIARKNPNPSDQLAAEASSRDAGGPDPGITNEASGSEGLGPECHPKRDAPE